MNAFTKKIMYLCMIVGIVGQSLECMEPLIKGVIPVKHTIISTALGALLSYDFTFFKKIPTESGVLAVAFSPNGKTLLTGSYDNLACLWDVTTGKLIKEFKGHTHWVLSVAFSPDGKSALTGSLDGTARLWDIKSGGLVKELIVSPEAINSVVFSSDGRFILTGSWDKTVRLWDAETGEQLKVFTGIDGSVVSVVVSPNGIYVGAGSDTGRFCLWDMESGELVREFNNHYPIYSLAFSPDGKTIFVGSVEEAYLWDIAKGTIVETFKVGEFAGDADEDFGAMIISVADCPNGNIVAFSPDGNTVIIGTNGGNVSLWDVKEGKELKELAKYSKPVRSVAYSRDGTMIVTVAGDEVDLWKLSGDSGKWIETRTKAAYQLYKERFASL